VPGDPDADVDDAVLAATVIVLRDGDQGVETLLLRRNSKLGFAGGMWVFPGGRVDEGDAAAGDDEEAVARRAAVREAREEAGIELEPDALVALSHWTPDRASKHKRFATWFFVAVAAPGDVVIDGGEIVDHVWATPAAALDLHAAGEVELLPPTYVTLSDLASHEHTSAVLAAAGSGGVPRFLTRILRHEGVLMALWAGDAGYEDGDPSRAGTQHRLLMGELPWRYVRD
jgi:8-oxo-dGTP pyrophosphatase MutT (NUDIX family)